MKKKILFISVLGVIGGLLGYWYYTFSKVWDIDTESLDDDDDEYDIDYDDEIAEDFDNENPVFDDIEDDIFTASNESILDNTTVNVLDDDVLENDLICNVSRTEAIALIHKMRDNYSVAQLTAMTNAELASLYSEIINN